MPERLMFVQLKSGYDKDRGPCWIGNVIFSSGQPVVDEDAREAYAAFLAGAGPALGG